MLETVQNDSSSQLAARQADCCDLSVTRLKQARFSHETLTRLTALSAGIPVPIRLPLVPRNPWTFSEDVLASWRLENEMRNVLP